MEFTEETLQWEDMKSVFPKDLMDTLFHNKPPTEGTLRTISAIRRNPESLVTASIERRKFIDREIKKLKEESQRLSNAENVRATIRSACDAVSAPIRRVPLDVIREIALFASDVNPSASSKSSLLTLTRVCSAWRSAVLSSPLLWSTLYLKIKTIDQDSIVKYVATVQNWFLRAAGAPKRFFLYVVCPIATSTQSYHFHLFLKAIGPSLTGLSCLGIGSQNWANLMMQFVDITWDVNNLRSVEVLGQLAHGTDHLGPEMAKLASVAHRIILFRKASLLTKMVAAQELRPYPLSSTFLPWHQITDISLVESYRTQIPIIDTLRNAPQLRTARLICGSLRPREGTTTFIHKNLEHLTLGGLKSNAHDLLAFLSNCIFPNLKQFRLDGRKMKEPQPSDQTFTISAFPSLEVLMLTDDIRIPTDHLLSLLRGTPKLQILSMHVADSDGHSTDLNSVFASITIENGHCKMLPRLERCLFYGVADIPGTKFFLDASLVSRFIHSRFEDLPEGCNRLRDIRLRGCFDFLTDVQAEVTHLSQGKNKVAISCTDDFVGNPPDALEFKIPFTSTYFMAVDHWHKV